ncbi:MAG: alpha/beta hydrolase [Cyanobacteria bacterium J06592_8]
MTVYRYWSKLRYLIYTAIAILLTTLPAQATENITFVFSLATHSVSVQSLETFARTGQIDSSLRTYMNLARITEEEKKQEFRASLTKPIAVEDPDLVVRILNTDEGKRLLTILGKIINAQRGRNGQEAIRSAIVSATQQPERLTLLNFFRNFPGEMVIDLERSLNLAKNIDIVVEGTNRFVKEMAKLSAQEVAAEPFIDFSQLPDLRQTGNIPILQKRWTLTDTERERTFYVDVYQPQQLRFDPIPVVIISHGLNSKPEDFADKAKHLASYGFFVVLPQHRGSDAQYTEAFRQGEHPNISALDEFINRPLDISYTLDELERRNPIEFEGRLNLERVGIDGHSYGGYTALAVAGASPTPNFAQLERDCQTELGELNTALFLQCRALQLDRKTYNFRDERIQAVVAENPVNASIFGPEGMGKISIPIAIGAGSYDPATPFAFEQARSFPWITAPERYLSLREGQAHLDSVDISELDGGASQLMGIVPDLDLPSPQLLSGYAKAFSLAFFEVYIANNTEYRSYLNPGYAAYLSQGQKFKTYVITGASTEQLAKAINQFIIEKKIDSDQ